MGRKRQEGNAAKEALHQAALEGEDKCIECGAHPPVNDGLCLECLVGTDYDEDGNDER